MERIEAKLKNETGVAKAQRDFNIKKGIFLWTRGSTMYERNMLINNTSVTYFQFPKMIQLISMFKMNRV